MAGLDELRWSLDEPQGAPVGGAQTPTQQTPTEWSIHLGARPPLYRTCQGQRPLRDTLWCRSHCESFCPCVFVEEHCIVNCEARPPHSKVQPPQNPSTATFRNRENQNGPLGTAMILMGPTGVNIGQFLSISVNIGQFLSISVNSGRSMFLNEFRQTSVNFCQFLSILADPCFCVIHIQAGAAHYRPWINMPTPSALVFRGV